LFRRTVVPFGLSLRHPTRVYEDLRRKFYFFCYCCVHKRQTTQHYATKQHHYNTKLRAPYSITIILPYIKYLSLNASIVQGRSYRAHWAQLAQNLGAKNPGICAQSVGATPLRPQIGHKFPGFWRKNKSILIDRLWRELKKKSIQVE
jgi:hypothetical protein